jgi:hypothetical protein
MGVWIGFIWLRIETSGRLMNTGSINVEEFFEQLSDYQLSQ